MQSDTQSIGDGWYDVRIRDSGETTDTLIRKLLDFPPGTPVKSAALDYHGSLIEIGPVDEKAVKQMRQERETREIYNRALLEPEFDMPLREVSK